MTQLVSKILPVAPSYSLDICSTIFTISNWPLYINLDMSNVSKEHKKRIVLSLSIWKAENCLSTGIHYDHLCRSMTKQAKWYVHPAKTQISQGIHPVWSESSLCAQWVAIRTQGFFMGTVMTRIRLSGYPGFSEYSLGAHAILLDLPCSSSFSFHNGKKCTGKLLSMSPIYFILQNT